MELVERSRPVGLLVSVSCACESDTHAETDHAHDDHSDDVDYRSLQPLSECRSAVQVVVATCCSLLGGRLSRLTTTS
jgi:hypothetical protein